MKAKDLKKSLSPREVLYGILTHMGPTVFVRRL